MGFKPRDKSTSYSVKDGDTLASVAAAAGVSETELCLHNFGTKEKHEVQRALVEIVGCQPVAGGGEVKLSSTDATRGTGKLLLPLPFSKEGLATGTTHTLTVRQPRPMPAVEITELDRWFIPGAEADGGEKCLIGYRLEGIKERADKVKLEVYPSGYAEAQVDAQGKVTFTAVAGAVPVYERQQPADRSAPAGALSYKIVDWDGRSTAASGALKPSGAEKRYLNVAFSPYTVLLRYYKTDGDKQARILLQDFWPRWDAGGVLEPASLHIKYKVENASRLKHGQIVVWNGKGEVVQRLALKAADLSAGDHDRAWDGKLADGTFLKKNDMPYRVQVLGHTDMTDEQGLALSAMHTEVRLFVHPKTGTELIKEMHKEPPSLALSLAPSTPKVPAQGDGDRWVQYRLAETGFHPGPVSGTIGPDAQRAIKELQRTVAQNAAAPYTRLTVSGNADAATKTALARIADDWHPMYGDPGSTPPTDLARAAAGTRLADKDHTDGLALWVDDRHAYTAAAPAGRPFLDPKMFMNDYRGGMSIGDARSTKDADSIPRPWIPVQADLPLLSRQSGLDAERGVVNAATRKAVGPLRVDWTFGEIDQDLSPIDRTHAGYVGTRTRSQKFVEKAGEAVEVTFGGVKHRNCPEDRGGIRPANMAEYYKRGFGFGTGGSLPPWRDLDDAAQKAICCLVHDDLGQAADAKFATHLGRAGALFRPSIVGGDGYRLRARVSFEALPGGESQLPNREVLGRRYPKLPHAHSCKLRVWRKTSYRGYAAWCPGGESHWPGHKNPCAEYYQGAFLTFVDEPGPNPALSAVHNVPGLVSQAEYRTCVSLNVTHASYSGLAIVLKLDRVWPYCDLPHLGIPQGGPGTTLRNFYAQVFNPAFNETWRKYRADLLHLLLKKVEQTTGRLRGHFLVEFRSSQSLTIEEYRCSDPACPATRAEITTNCAPGDLLVGSPCPTGTAGHTMVRHAPPRTQVRGGGIPLPAVGVALGATWLFTSGGADVWAHELGHHRHLQHAQGYPSSTSVAPGAQPAQHDSAVNPNCAGLPVQNPANPNKDRCWDRNCVMSYTHGEPLYFCGKCLLKNRGWKVQTLANPAGNVQD